MSKSKMVGPAKSRGVKSVMFPRGMTFETKPAEGGGVAWWLRSFGREVGSGIARTEAAAWAAVKEKLQELTAKRVKRSALRAKWRSWCERRPYLVQFVLESFAMGIPMSAMSGHGRAAEIEERYWREDPYPGKSAQPPGHHPLTKHASDVVKELDALVRVLLGPAVQINAWRLGLKYFGPNVWKVPKPDKKAKVAFDPVKGEAVEVPSDHPDEVSQDAELWEGGEP